MSDLCRVMKKDLLPQTPYIRGKEWKHYSYGYDCLPRSVYVKQVTGIDLSWGMLLVRSKFKVKNPVGTGTLGPRMNEWFGWVRPYGFHFWNENDTQVFDDPTRLFSSTLLDLSKVTSVEVMDAPRFTDTNKSLTYVRGLCKRLMLTSKADVIYLRGFGWDMDTEKGEVVCMTDRMVDDWITKEQGILREVY